MAQLRFVILINKLFFCSAVVGRLSLVSELATRRFGVATAKLEWWARLRAHAQARRAVSKLGLGLSGENHSAKTNLTTEPIAAPPTLCLSILVFELDCPWHCFLKRLRQWQAPAKLTRTTVISPAPRRKMNLPEYNTPYLVAREN